MYGSTVTSLLELCQKYDDLLSGQKNIGYRHSFEKAQVLKNEGINTLSFYLNKSVTSG